MSNRRKNNHYHYAEKFENKDRSSSRGKIAYMPFKSVIISLAVLLMFGFVTTTFAAYVSDNEPEEASEFSPIISEVRNLKDSRDIAVTGADVDLASTGGNVTGGTVVVEVPSSWTSYSNIQFGLYQNGYLWCSADMTRITNTNFYYGSNPSHGSWADEQIMFMANNSHFGSGSFDGTNSAKYSEKITQAMSSNYYTYWLSGSANAYTNTYKGNFDSLANAIYIYDQTAYIYTSTTGSAVSNYSSSGTGGNVEITASYLNTDNNSATQTTTPSSNGATSVTYEHAVYHTAVTYKATANTGYRFVGWYTSTTSTSAASTNATYTRTNSLTGTNTLYARFLKTYDISITKSPSGYSGTAPSIGSGTDTSLTVDVGTSVTLNNNLAANSDISCIFRKGSATGTVVTSPQTINADTTFYACYSLAAPTITDFSYDSSIVADGTDSISPTKTVSGVPTDGTQTSDGAQTITYSIAPNTGTTAASGTYSVASDGTVTATTPGQYIVTMTVTDTLRNLTSESATDTAIVTVKPIAVSANVIMCSAVENTYTSGSGTYAVPYKTPVDRTLFTISSYIPNSALNSNYTYNWTRTDGTYLISDGTITDGSHSVTSTNVTSISDTASACTLTTEVIHNTVPADDTGYIYKIAVTANQNGVSSDPTYVTVYYGVTAEFLNLLSYDFSGFNPSVPKQKVYAEDNNITAINATYDAGAVDTFNTMLYFSNNNIGFSKVSVWTKQDEDTYSFTINDGPFAGTHTALPFDDAHKVSTLIETISTIARNSVNLMSTTGPKWFKSYVDDYSHARVEAVYPELHTTVGTASTVSNRPIYYVDNAHGTDVTVNTRVMAFFLEESDETNIVHYQTAQAVSGRTNTYRFYIPSDATYITFAHVANNNYVIPTASQSGDSLSYSGYASTVLKAWTPTINLNAAANIGMTTFVADTAGSPTNGIYNYTNTDNSGNMTTLG